MSPPTNNTFAARSAHADCPMVVLDETAILGIGDLGTLGQTWSLAGPSFADGVLYHHSSKEVVAIGSQP
ncbi:MAG TPA: hypothetical protein VIK01_24070 [Polyangiaceae bacterium]